jgi:hypothetical protein
MTRTALVLAVSAMAWCGTRVDAQQAASVVELTATSANVAQPGSSVSIRILRWSTEDERGPVVAAMNPAARGAAPPPAARGARGAAPGRGGRGARGRGDAVAPPNPMAALTAAIGKAPTVGYIWTNAVTGYSIKYAYHAPLTDGSERIILATDRRLGAYTAAWKPVAAPAAADYDFTLLELRIDPGGSGEGKASLTTKVIVDNEAKTLALDDYAAAPAILVVKR